MIALPVAPRSVTRGESSGGEVAKVDWLNCTFPGPDRYTPVMFVALLSRLFGRPVRGVVGRGIFGFDQSVKMLAGVGSSEFPIGCIAFGGVEQRGRWMLQLTGSGCSVVRSWSRLSRLLQALGARITRLDLCIDYLDGCYSVDDAVSMYREGAFNCGGRSPSSACAGDWLDGVNGRTLYIGKAVNGKLLRVYEKGRQLGNPESPWVRYEVQLGNRDRVIPFEAMTEPGRFLAGCYPALASMMECASESISTAQTGGQVSMTHLMFHLKNSYGRLIHTLGGLAAPDSALIEAVTVTGAPRRLKPSDISSGLTWDQLMSQIRRVEHEVANCGA